MRRKKDSPEVKIDASHDAPDQLPLLSVETVSRNATGLFAHIFNIIPSGIHTFRSVSPSLEEISFSVNKAGNDIFWNTDFDEFMDAFVCRMALTGRAIITANSFMEDSLRSKNLSGKPTLAIMGWHIFGDASSILPFDKRMMKNWHNTHGVPREGMRVVFHDAYVL